MVSGMKELIKNKMKNIQETDIGEKSKMAAKMNEMPFYYYVWSKRQDDMTLLGLHSEWAIFRDMWRDLIWGKRLTLA